MEHFESKPIQFLVASMAKALRRYKFHLRDFTTANIDNINRTIQALTKPPPGKSSETERKVELKKPPVPKSSGANMLLVKRYAP